MIMKIELFATSRLNKVEYLGCFVKEEHALEAVDQYVGMGYKNPKLIVWKANY